MGGSTLQEKGAANMGKRSAAGSIRQRKDGRWEARYTANDTQRSIYGKTQKEVRQKLTAILVELDNGTYQAPNKITLGDWLTIWERDYLKNVKPRTVENYQGVVRLYIAPVLGNKKLQALSTAQIQSFYNGLHISPKTIKNVHGVLHRALNDAAAVGLIHFNPSTVCKLPRVIKPDIRPFDEQQIAAFLQAIQGHPYENVYFVTLFCGLRQGEVLGLTWDCVDFQTGTLTINKQLQRHAGGHSLVPTKNNKPRYIKPAQAVLKVLQRQSMWQKKARVRAGQFWNNELNLVFTNEIGENIAPNTLYTHFKSIAASIGAPQTRFHDLRHSYAVLSLKSGDDIKTVQSNLGHHTAAFTLDTYAYVTEQMKRESANRMDKAIANLLRVN